MAEIASLFVTVGAETGAFTSGLSEVDTGLQGVSGRLQNVGQQVHSFGETLTGVGTRLTVGLTAPIVGIGTASLNMAAEFDQAMRNVNAIVQLPEESFQELTQSVLEFAGTTRASATDVAGALYNVVSAGFDAEDAFIVMTAASRAAGAGLAEMEDVSRPLIAALSSYGLEAEEAARVTDIFLQSVNAGILNLPDLASSLGRVIPQAASLGVSLEEVGFALAELTNTGLSADEAVTRLNQVFVSLIKPSEDLQAAIEQLGYASGSELVEATGGALGALRILRDEGFLTTNEQVAALFPNIRALGGVLALTRDDATLAAGAVEGFGLAAEGAVERARVEQYQSLSAQLALARGAFEALGIAIGMVLIPPLVEVAQAITPFVQGLATANPEIIRLGVVVGGLAATLGPLTTMAGLFIQAGGALISFTGSVAGVVGAGASIVAALNPVVLVVGAIAAGIGALALAWRNNWLDIRGVTANAIDVVFRLIDTLALRFSFIPDDLATSLRARIGELVNAARELGASFVNALIDAIPDPIADLLGLTDVTTQAQVNVTTQADQATRDLIDLRGQTLGVGIEPDSRAQLNTIISQLQQDYDVSFVAGPEATTLFAHLGITAGTTFGQTWADYLNSLFNNFEDLFPGGPPPGGPIGPEDVPWVHALVSPLPLPVEIEGFEGNGIGGPHCYIENLIIQQNPNEPTQELIDRLIFELEQLCQAQGGFMT